MNSSQTGSPYPRTYFPGVTSKALATVVHVKEGEALVRLDLQMPSPLTQQTVEGIVAWSDGRPAAGANVYLNLIEEGGMSASSLTAADESGRFSLKLYKGLQYKVSAYLQYAANKQAQSEWIEIPLNSVEPIRIVLPAQPR